MKRQFKKTRLALQLLRKLDEHIIIDSISNHIYVYVANQRSKIDEPLLIYELETGKLIRNNLDDDVAHTPLQLICRRVTRLIEDYDYFRADYMLPANFYADCVDDVLYDKNEEQTTGNIEDYVEAKYGDNPQIKQYLVEELKTQQCEKQLTNDC